MTVETASYISQLNPAYPAAGDPKSEGDDHIRLGKQVLQNQFPNLGATAVTATAAQLNNVPNASLRAGDTYTGTHDFTGATINVPTQSATDNDTSAASTAMVQAAILASSGVTAALPGQGGNSGKFLTTNGTSASWASVPGQSGTIITGNVTLTASSAAGMSVTPTSPGLYATLPDATTCSKATTLFSIYNAGDYDYGVKDSAGTQLGWVRARTGAMIGLADNSTAAGTWAYYGLEKLGVTAYYTSTTAITGGGDSIPIALDATRTALITDNGYCIVYDSSTSTFGSPVLVRSAPSLIKAILSAANQILVVTCDSTTGFQAVTLTISGTSVTVNSAATATLAGNYSNTGQAMLIAVGSSFVINYDRATTTTAVRAMTISGTTVTIGAETTLQTTLTNPICFIAASGSVLRTVCGTAANSGMTAQPYTVSGTTLTPGTSALIAVTSTASTNWRAITNANGNIVMFYLNSTMFGAVIKLTVTTEAVSAVTVGTAPTSSFFNQTDTLQIGSKTVVGWFDGTNFNANILTDTSGTASAGTAISGAYSSTGMTSAVGTSGNNAYFSTGGNVNLIRSITLDCSGSSPVFSKIVVCIGSGASTGNFQYSSQYGSNRRSPVIVAGTTAYALGGDFAAATSPNAAYRVRTPAITNSSGVSLGAVNWLNSAATNSYTLQRIEAAA